MAKKNSIYMLNDSIMMCLYCYLCLTLCDRQREIAMKSHLDYGLLFYYLTAFDLIIFELLF